MVDRLPCPRSARKTVHQTPTKNSEPRGARRSHRQKKKRFVIALNLAVLFVLAGGTVAYGALSKTVTLDVDGKKDTVRTFGATVGSVLTSHDVKVDDDATVNVKPTAAVGDGDTIAVRYVKPVTVTVDGTSETTFVKAATVGDALDLIGVRPEKGAYVSETDSTVIPRTGADIVVSNPKKLTVAADGQKKTIVTSAATVGEAVRDAGVALGPLDDTGAQRTDYVKPGQTIDVDRIQLVDKTETVTTKPKVVYKDDDSMEKGTTKVLEKGEAGKARERVVFFVADGKRRDRVVLSSDKLSEPTARVVARGTAEAPSVDDGSVWDRLAQCESGGNWSINTGNGYYGGLQFSAATWRSVGGPGLPHQQSREVQIKYAKILQARSGWGQWSCASAIGH